VDITVKVNNKVNNLKR